MNTKFIQGEGRRQGIGKTGKADRQSTSKRASRNLTGVTSASLWLPATAYRKSYRDSWNPLQKGLPHSLWQHTSPWQPAGSLKHRLKGNTKHHRAEGREAASQLGAVCQGLQCLCNTTVTGQFPAAPWGDQERGCCWKPWCHLHKSPFGCLSCRRLLLWEPSCAVKSSGPVEVCEAGQRLLPAAREAVQKLPVDWGTPRGSLWGNVTAFRQPRKSK